MRGSFDDYFGVRKLPHGFDAENRSQRTTHAYAAGAIALGCSWKNPSDSACPKHKSLLNTTSLSRTMRIISHRGNVEGSLEPENSLGAFKTAIAAGVDGIETDARLTKDGRLVLHHDRLAPNSARISDVTKLELDALAGHVVPELADALALSLDILWNIEIKVPQALSPVIATLKRIKPREVLITSFDHQIITTCAKRTGLSCGLLISHRPADFDWLVALRKKFPRITYLVWNTEFVDRQALLATAARGYQNLLYGFESSAEHSIYQKMRVAGIITDFPSTQFKEQEGSDSQNYRMGPQMGDLESGGSICRLPYSVAAWNHK